MEKSLEIGSIAPDFELKDAYGKSIKLSDFTQEKNIVLIFNRGFA